MHLPLALLVSAIAVMGLLGQDRPNVLLIISDDHSWTDYSFMGHEVIETPALDRLASESLTYTRGYVTSPLCRPSLASIFTGLHTPAHRITGNDLRIRPDGTERWSRKDPLGARKHEEIYAEFETRPGIAALLKKAGYLSLQTGKWWEGKPQRHGFTHAMTHADPARKGRHGDLGLRISREGIKPIQDFLDQAQEQSKPFFIWHAPFLPHTPHNPPEALYQKYLAKEPNKYLARYYAMVEWFDQTCGELLTELQTRRLSENTIVIYITDNGWIQSPDSGAFAPLSKQDAHEGGIRTPVMLRWPGKVPPLIDKNTLVSAIDIAPTILKALDLDIPRPMKGIPLQNRKALAERNTIFGFDGNHDIFDLQDRTSNLETLYLIRGDWKLLIHNPENYGKPYNGRPTGHPKNPDGHPELYHLIDDPLEKRNLAQEKPAKVAALRQSLEQWYQTQKRNAD